MPVELHYLPGHYRGYTRKWWPKKASDVLSSRQDAVASAIPGDDDGLRPSNPSLAWTVILGLDVPAPTIDLCRTGSRIREA